MLACTLKQPAQGIHPGHSDHSGHPDQLRAQDLLPEQSNSVVDALPSTAAKKRKKKRSKKKSDPGESQKQQLPSDSAPKSSVLCISRNKHWRYISSYHGPWLQLPVELLESLLSLNLDPAAFSTYDSASSTRNTHLSIPRPQYRPRSLSPQPSDSDTSIRLSSPLQPNHPYTKPNVPIPPPIDPGVFRSVTSIRRYIDEASDLAVRAASGLSAAALGAVRGGSNSVAFSSSSPWATAQSLGINPFNEQLGSGRNVTMSATRVHRLRALAVNRLAAAYRTDEIAASVMVMQGASALDDIAERVLKLEPQNTDALYVHFFHEKIPSRQLAECTTTTVLDELIRAEPHVLEYHRTRGIVHCFRDEYQMAIRDFTYALKEGRTLRKARHVHAMSNTDDTLLIRRLGKARKGKKGNTAKINGQAPPDGTAAPEEDNAPLVHSSLLPDAPSALEHQLLFLRGAAYLQSAIYLIEQAILEVEGLAKHAKAEGIDYKRCYWGNPNCGNGGEPTKPDGTVQSKKIAKYRNFLAAQEVREKVAAQLRKSIRDHEKFLSHFDTFDRFASATEELNGKTEPEEAEMAYLISEPARTQQASARHSDAPPSSFTTYHPLLVESHFSILLCLTLMGQFEVLLPTFTRTATIVDNLEGYPIFLPARSMAQAEFIEVLERLASGWRAGNMTGGEPEGLMGDRLRALKMILNPVVKRQKERAEQALNGEKKKGPLSIPLHGPRVDIILAWLGSTHLPDMLEIATPPA